MHIHATKFQPKKDDDDPDPRQQQDSGDTNPVNQDHWTPTNQKTLQKGG